MPIGKVSGYSPDLRLETPRLTLRRIEEKDLPKVHALQSARHVEEADAVVYPESYLRAKFERWQEDAKTHNWGMFVVEEKSSGDFVGTMGLESSPYNEGDFERPVEFSFARVKEEYMNKGYFQEATAAVMIHAFEETGVENALFLTVNPKCCHIAKKSGFIQVKNVDVTFPFWDKDKPYNVTMFRLTRDNFLLLKAQAKEQKA